VLTQPYQLISYIEHLLIIVVYGNLRMIKKYINIWDVIKEQVLEVLRI